MATTLTISPYRTASTLSNNALYAMTEFDKDELSGNVGLRVAQTKVYSLSYQALPTSGTGSCVALAPCSVLG